MAPKAGSAKPATLPAATVVGPTSVNTVQWPTGSTPVVLNAGSAVWSVGQTTWHKEFELKFKVCVGATCHGI